MMEMTINTGLLERKNLLMIRMKRKNKCFIRCMIRATLTAITLAIQNKFVMMQEIFQQLRNQYTIMKTFEQNLIENIFVLIVF